MWERVFAPTAFIYSSEGVVLVIYHSPGKIKGRTSSRGLIWKRKFSWRDTLELIIRLKHRRQRGLVCRWGKKPFKGSGSEEMSSDVKKWKGGRRLARPGPPAKVSDQGISVCHQQTCGGQISGRKTSSSRSPPFMFPATDRTNHPRTLYSHLFLRSQWLRLWLYAQFSTKHRSPMYVRLMNIYS